MTGLLFSPPASLPPLSTFYFRLWCTEPLAPADGFIHSSNIEWDDLRAQHSSSCNLSVLFSLPYQPSPGFTKLIHTCSLMCRLSELGFSHRGPSHRKIREENKTGLSLGYPGAFRSWSLSTNEAEETKDSYLLYLIWSPDVSFWPALSFIFVTINVWSSKFVKWPGSCRSDVRRYGPSVCAGGDLVTLNYASYVPNHLLWCLRLKVQVFSAKEVRR